MNAEQVVQALVTPGTGIIFKILDRIQSIENHNGEADNVLKVHGNAIASLNEAIEGLRSEIATLIDGTNELSKRLDQLHEHIEHLAAAKRSRSKKKEEQPAPAVEEPAEVVDPTAPAYEPGLVPDTVAGVEMTGKVVLNIRNNIRVLTVAQAKLLDPETPPEVYDFVAGLTDDEVDAIVAKFPG